MSNGRIRLLIFAEAVTLAHLARPVALAAGLSPQRFDVHLAAASRFDALLGDLPHARHGLDSISPAQFLDALARGAPIYTEGDLRRYVREDLSLLGRVAPDVVVGDLRLSLSVSARLARVPYATITNAYWSPWARQRFPLPELPLTRTVGVGLARAVFPLARRLAFALHAVPLNRVRREHGLPSLGPDLRRTYTDADQVLYADAPDLAPPLQLPPGHRFLGPVLWSPAVAEPDWWKRLPDDRPLVYVTLGSSGPERLLDATLRALGDQRVTVVAASAGGRPRSLPSNTFAAEYLPGETAARRAALVVCNGGSPTVQQALAAGRPVLGLAANMDQHLSMQSVERAGAGILVRSEKAAPAVIARAVRRLLDEPEFRDRSESIAARFAALDAPAAFARAVEEMATRQRETRRRSRGRRVDRAAAGAPPPRRP